MVVYLAVENEPDISAFAAAHWLMSCRRQIDDREPAKTNSAAAVIENMSSRVVRPAMRHRVAHSFDEGNCDTPFARSILPNSDNSAHISFPYCRLTALSTPIRIR